MRAVSAIDEIVTYRGARKLTAIAEAGFWVAGGLILLRLAGLTMAEPAGYLPSGWTIAGGILLGLGALVNRACVFGAVVRFGAGEWEFALTPAGFVAGAALAAPLV